MGRLLRRRRVLLLRRLHVVLRLRRGGRRLRELGAELHAWADAGRHGDLESHARRRLHEELCPGSRVWRAHDRHVLRLLDDDTGRFHGHGGGHCRYRDDHLCNRLDLDPAYMKAAAVKKQHNTTTTTNVTARLAMG